MDGKKREKISHNAVRIAFIHSIHVYTFSTMISLVATGVSFKGAKLSGSPKLLKVYLHLILITNIN